MADEKTQLAKQRAAEREAAREARMAELKAEREQRAAEAAAARASKPATNPTVRPEGNITDDKIEYFSWIGGGTTGSWKKYVAPNTDENMSKYGPRTVGGETQNKLDGSSAGANALTVRPVLLKDNAGNVIGYQSADGKSVVGSASNLPAGYNIDMNAVKAAGNAIDAALANRAWLSIEDPMKSLQALSTIIGQFHQPGSAEYMSALVSAAQMGSRSHTDINGVTGTLAKFLNENISAEQGKQIGIDTLAFQIGSDRFGAPRQNLPFTGGGSVQNLPFTGGASVQNLPYTGSDPAALAAIKTLQDQITALTKNVNNQTAAANQAAIDKAAADAAATKVRTDNAILAVTDRFNKYGLGSLVPKIRELAISGASEDTIALQLQETPEYKQRFIGNEERIKKGLRVLDPGTYIGLEDRYRQIIRAYGLKQFDNDAYVTQFISNDVSPEEVSSRVVNAVQRVQNADPAVSQMLRQYYNIGVTDMVAYVLDPTNQLPKIERQIGAAEIGVAAGRQGLTAGVNVAEQLAAQGVTEAEARRGYSTIADILPQATKLSQIYTGVLDQYGQAEAEQEVFNSLASAQRKRRALAEREIATFGGSSGTGRTSLSNPMGGQFQIPDVDPSAPRSVLDRQ